MGIHNDTKLRIERKFKKMATLFQSLLTEAVVPLGLTLIVTFPLIAPLVSTLTLAGWNTVPGIVSAA